MRNPKGTAKGYFGYTDGTWKDRHKHGDAHNNADQISAFYGDIKNYTERYHALPTDRLGDASLDEYIYIKHHDGPNAENLSGTAPGRQIWNKVDFTAPDELFSRDGMQLSSAQATDAKFASTLEECHRAMSQSLQARDYDPAAREEYAKRKSEMDRHLEAIHKDPSLLSQIGDSKLRKTTEDRLAQWQRQNSHSSQQHGPEPVA